MPGPLKSLQTPTEYIHSLKHIITMLHLITHALLSEEDIEKRLVKRYEMSHKLGDKQMGGSTIDELFGSFYECLITALINVECMVQRPD